MLLFLIAEKGPRAAKISWRAASGPRAALWPCLVYKNKMYLASNAFIISKLITKDK